MFYEPLVNLLGKVMSGGIQDFLTVIGLGNDPLETQ